MKFTRREFGGRMAKTGLAVAGVGLPQSLASCAGSAQKKALALPIVDTHQHLWDLARFRPPWLASAPKVLSRSYVTKDYVEATEGLNVVQAIYMEVDVAPERQVDEAEHVILLSKSDQHPTAAAVISGRPASEAFRPYILRYKDNPYVKGVRQVLQVTEAPRGLCLEAQFIRSVQLLGELGKSFDLCMRPRELADGVELARQCAGTRFIVDHCGNADPKAFVSSSRRGGETPWHDADEWKRDMAAFATLPNVICKISGIIARAPRGSWGVEDLAPIVNFCLDEFSPNRVVFGSDWPVCKLVASYAQWVKALKEIIANRNPIDQRKLLSENAVRLYGLQPRVSS